MSTTNDSEPRALSAALAAPAFVTRGMGTALHVANRHVERWAPEADVSRVRPMRSLGFVDRLVAPWMETAQRSASMRLFSQYATAGMGERGGSAVSWVFPRPWYQDELDWMAAARQVRTSSAQSPQQAPAPTLLTTRGTYVAPIAAPQLAMPSALYEYVAPSLSIAAPQPAAIPGVGYGGETLARGEAYSPLVSLASVQAAELMSRAVSPLAAQRASAPVAGMPARPMMATSAMTPGLRAVLTTILERAAAPRIDEVSLSRLAGSAPHMETPPAPSEPAAPVVAPRGRAPSAASASATQVADQYAEQRTHIVELQRIAQQSAQREVIARAESARVQAAEAAARATTVSSGTSSASSAAASSGAAASSAASSSAASSSAASSSAVAQAAQLAAAQVAQTAATQAAQTAATSDVRASAERAEAELRERIGTTRASEAQQSAADRARAEAIEAAQERARVEQRIAQRLAERTGGQRMHEQARAEAAAHARTPIEPTRAVAAPVAPVAPPPVAYRPSAEVAAAIAGLPPELAAMLAPALAQRPERAMQAIHELNDTLRTVELLARSSAAGTAFEATRGPRLVMPAGLGGLVNAVDRAQSISERPAMLGGQRPLAPLTSLGALGPLGEPPAASPAQARLARDVRVPTLAWLSPVARPQAMAPVTALDATATASPVALSHVAWADRWLARFAGATPQSLDMISAAAAAAPEVRLQALANAAPSAVFVVPEMIRGDLAGERAAAASSRALASRAVAAAPSAAASSAAASSAAASSAAASSTAASSTAAQSGPPTQVPGLRLINPPGEPLRRFDDDAETPDDVFVAISASAARNRSAPSRPAAPGSIAAQAQAQAQAVQAQAAQAQLPAFDRSTLADLVAHSAPSAPGAGLSAQLSSSPFAPALRHLLPIASSASFDVRALFGAGLGATYLAGLIGPASRELEIGAQMTPAWASWSAAPLNQQADIDQPDRLDRMVPSFDPTYLRADALDVRDPRAVEAAGGSVEQLRALEQLRAVEQLRAGEPASAGEPGAVSGATAAALAAAIERGSVPAASLTTLRTALLSWDVASTASDIPGAPPITQLVPGSFATAQAPARTGVSESAYQVSAARTMIEAMSLPMLGDIEQDSAPAWGAPGMVADRAHAWSVAQERSASDLALDFVSPELVLAARVYGLGPAEAAQAARLAIVGPGQLGAMASMVDRTFVEAMAIGRDARGVESERARRGASSAAWTASMADGASDGGAARAADRTVADRAATAADRAAGVSAPPITGDARGAITTAFPQADGTIAAAIAPTTRAPLPPASGSSFGVDRRAPRGAFLWPAATIAALGLNAAGSDGQLSMSVAALEMLAAQVVVELGTYSALSDADAAARGIAGEQGARGAYGAGAYGADGAGAFAAEQPGVTASGAAASGAASADGSATLSSSAARGDAAGPLATFAARRAASDGIAAAEPGEADVLGAAAALVPASRRARFDALYVALSQSGEGRSWSPAARAARALALAGRGDGATISARERATSAWDVLPVVYPGALGGAPASTEHAGDGPISAAASAAALMATYVARPSPSDVARPSRGAVSPQRGGTSGRRGARAAEVSDDMIQVTSSPGLEGLSARAGNALGAYVNPVAPPSAPVEASSSGHSGAMHRAPSAAPEYVQTRSGGRHGGGEVEIPPWFEAAARKMLAERSGDSDGISLAELTLVNAAPATHIAASSVAPSAPSPTTPGAATTSAPANAPKIDVEKIANELYHDIMVLMDVARARNGNPYQ